MRSKLDIDIVAFGHYADLSPNIQDMCSRDNDQIGGDKDHGEDKHTNVTTIQPTATVEAEAKQPNPLLRTSVDATKDQTYFLW